VSAPLRKKKPHLDAAAMTVSVTLAHACDVLNLNAIPNFVIGIETAPIVPQEGAERSVLKALL
jgi:hypothetical protein